MKQLNYLEHAYTKYTSSSAHFRQMSWFLPEGLSEETPASSHGVGTALLGTTVLLERFHLIQTNHACVGGAISMITRMTCILPTAHDWRAISERLVKKWVT